MENGRTVLIIHVTIREYHINENIRLLYDGYITAEKNHKKGSSLFRKISKESHPGTERLGSLLFLLDSSPLPPNLEIPPGNAARIHKLMLEQHGLNRI